MNRNMVIVLGGGFLIAVLVAVLVQASLGSKKVAVAEPPVQILIAAKDLPAGELLTDDDLKFQAWPKASLFPGAIQASGEKKPSELAVGRLNRPVATGEPVLENAIVKTGSSNFLAASLEPGMRAVAIDVNAVHTAGGFIGPGDYVDIILTYHQNVRFGGSSNLRMDEMVKLNLDQLATETILQNVKVLALDQNNKRDSDASAGKVGHTVTLQVDPRNAEVLALAGQVGTLSLSLRKLGDDKIVAQPSSVITDARLTHITRELYRQADKMSGQDNNNVRIYNGYNVLHSAP